MARKSTPNTTSTKGAPKGKGDNGPGKSRPIKTSAEQDEIRRAAKRRPSRTTGLSQYGSGRDLFTELYKDRRRQAEDAKHVREMEQWEFRRAQATKALEHDWFAQLRPGTTAHRFASKVLDIFPLAEPLGRPGQPGYKSRTQSALEDALDMMSDQDILNEKAIRHGKIVVSTALRWAYDQLKAEASELANA